ncbi:hypothetical protein JMJ55_14625 [Belnapia sp. T6]|uniref:Uncharacterized protein n=1 Tax=Belnapia mucosa TaxID=2804532 RepID=A0ABS1V4G3_9PROT|nr:hypothetical protein [Belnapia mucosa]MBL6456566.1 hypothetical protein [Belnapia mucosa]
MHHPPIHPQAAALFFEEAAAAPPAWSIALVIGALVLFVIGMAALLALLARRLLAEARAAGPAAFARLTELPCGVPDGTIRALISCFIVIFGFLLIGLQRPLGLASAEALTGFIGAVISFYFATRQGEQSRQPAPPPVGAQAAPPLPLRDAVEAAGSAVTAALGTNHPAAALIGDALAAFRASPALLGLGGPAGLVAAIGLGAVQAIGQGAEHFARWKTRILDRPYTADLFPPGPVDGAVALAALEAAPILARIFLTPDLPPAARFATAARLAALAQGETEAARAELATPGRFASEEEFAEGLQQFRGRLLDGALDAVDAAPISLAPAGLAAPPIPQAALREALAALRQEPAGRDLDSLVLQLTGLATNPEGAAPLLRRLLAAAAA